MESQRSSPSRTRVCDGRKRRSGTKLVESARTWSCSVIRLSPKPDSPTRDRLHERERGADRVEGHRPRRRLAAAVLVTTFGALACSSPVRAENRVIDVRAAVDQLYRPAHARLAAASQSLLDSSLRLCRAVTAGENERSTGAALMESRERFLETVAAFSGVELLRVGPIMEENRLYRLFYWPDTRRATERQLRELLGGMERELEPSDVRTLADRSVAVQGMPALERLLFTTVLTDVRLSTVGCALSLDIARNVNLLANELASEWNGEAGIVEILLRPHADSPLFRSDEEVTRSIFAQLSTGLERVATRKIGPMTDEGFRWREAPFARSGATLINLRGNLDSMQSLLEVTRMVDRTLLGHEVRFEFDVGRSHLDALAELQGLATPGGMIVPAARERMELLQRVVAGLAATVTDRIGPILRVSAGLNRLDGD